MWGDFEVVGPDEECEHSGFHASAGQMLSPVDQFQRKFEKGGEADDGVVRVDDGDSVHARGLIEKAPAIDIRAGGGRGVWRAALSPRSTPPNADRGVLRGKQRDHLPGQRTAWLPGSRRPEWPEHAVERYLRPPRPTFDILAEKRPTNGEWVVAGGITPGGQQAKRQIDDGEAVGHG